MTLHQPAHHRASPLPALLRPLGPLFEAIYRFGLGRRSRAFDRGKGVITLDRPVISVGNLSVGGTGKTPMVRRLLHALRAADLDPAIAMRGYASRNGLSDEAEEYRRTFDDLPMVVQPNRAQGLLDLFATDRGEHVDCILLDDGFQHRTLARDFDLVLIDATRDPFGDHLLPRGWLREPPTTLRRAHAIAITRADQAPAVAVRDIASRALQINPRLLVATYRHAWQSLTVYHAANGELAQREEPLHWLRAKRLGVACAIANPDALLAMVRAHASTSTLDPASTVILPDHDAYDAPALKRVLDLSHTVDALLVTDKDWSKLARVRPDLWGCPVVVPNLAMEPVTNLLRGQGEDPNRLESAAIATIRAFHAANDPVEPHTEAPDSDANA